MPTLQNSATQANAVSFDCWDSTGLLAAAVLLALIIMGLYLIARADRIPRNRRWPKGRQPEIGFDIRRISRIGEPSVPARPADAVSRLVDLKRPGVMLRLTH